MRGSVSEEHRNGPGVQEWPDGSKYEGGFLNGLKHGNGLFTWANGESYKGSFFKDYRHGSGTYCWPDGSQFTGKFYLNRKEGYGMHAFPNGAIFKGLYHADERFGPGIMMYPDGRQDVGLWYRQWLLHLCTSVNNGFTLMDFPEHVYRLTKQYQPTQTELQQFASHLLPPHQENRWFCSVDSSPLDGPSLLEHDRFILPPGIETYSTDSDHLPLPPRRQQQLDLHFFNRSDVNTPSLSNVLSLQQRMKAHICTHRFDAELQDWDVAAVLAMNRKYFGPKGSLELELERLIREASLGNLQNVQQILRDGKVHPDVADARGHTALIAAAENHHEDVIHLLLDSGADVNKLNNEGMSALAVCSMLCYPLKSLHETVAERTAQLVFTKSETRAPTASTSSSRAIQDAAVLTSEMPRDLTVTEPIFKNIAIDHTEQEDSSEGFSNAAEPEAAEYTKESKMPSKDLNSEDGLGNGSPVEGCILYSTHSDATEDSVQQKTKVLSAGSQDSIVKPQKTVHKMSDVKTEHQLHWTTMKLLLERGADPNASVTPMPAIFLAIKAGHVEAVQKLLECGARTDLHLPAQQKGLYSLHVAAGMPGPEGPKITELLLHAVADPDVKADDGDETYEQDKNSKDPLMGNRNRSSIGSGPPACCFATSTEMLEEGGRTSLHVACQRDTDYTNAKEVVSILLSHKASTNHLWSGHSPLSLAIASGNDLAVEELLAAGADPNLPLSRNVGSALCATANVHYNWGPHPRNRVKLVEKLMKAGANILMPVVVGDGQRSAVGTAVDYAHHSFNQDRRFSHTPYHALNQRERELYNARCQLLTVMGVLLRNAALSIEKQRLENDLHQGVQSASPTETFVFTGAVATPPGSRTRVWLSEEDKTSPNEAVDGERSPSKGQAETVIVRKPLFKYCYQCGRSAWVALTPCSRCRVVFYCSKTCKTKAWNEQHKEECVRVPGSGRREGSHVTGDQRHTLSRKSSRIEKDLHVKMDKPSLWRPAPNLTVHQHDPEENYSFI